MRGAAERSGGGSGTGTMLGVWLLLWGALAPHCRGEVASLRRAGDSSGRCTYSFTVASPVEATCPDADGVPGLRAELAALTARLSRLESRERGSGPRGGEAGAPWDPQQAAPAAYSELLRAKSRLEEEKRRLEREKEELGRRLESSAQEISRLRAARCPPGGEGPGRDTVRAPGKGKCREPAPPAPPGRSRHRPPPAAAPPGAAQAPSLSPTCAPTAAPRARGLVPRRGARRCRGALPAAPSPLPETRAGSQSRPHPPRSAAGRARRAPG